MDKQKNQSARMVGWFSLASSIVLLVLFIVKSAAGRDTSPALLVIAMVLLVTGIIGLARARTIS